MMPPTQPDRISPIYKPKFSLKNLPNYLAFKFPTYFTNLFKYKEQGKKAVIHALDANKLQK